MTRLASKDQLLKAYTGRDSAWWVEFCQEEIRKRFTDSPDPNHPYGDVAGWLHAMADEIAAHCQADQSDLPPNRRYDENLRAAAIAAVVFTAWGVRISHAKAYDPNRPVRLRRRALGRVRQLVSAIVDAATDESRDAEYFPGQEWNPPYGPSARGGTFI